MLNILELTLKHWQLSILLTTIKSVDAKMWKISGTSYAAPSGKLKVIDGLITRPQNFNCF
jgi:hypothetical protein